MSRKPKRRVEVWAVVDVDGSFLAGPSNSKGEVVREAQRRWGDHAFKATRFVPADPLAAAVVKAAKKLVAAYAEARKRDLRPEQYAPWLKAEQAHRIAVEKLERRR
jgi:hypothetical protein